MDEERVKAESVGRTCPYCLTDLKKDEEAHRCERCGAIHHADCWAEGGGCSVFGCASTVEQVAGTADTSTAETSSAPEPSEPTPDTPPYPSGHEEEDFLVQRREPAKQPIWKNRRTLLLLAAVAVLLAAIVAVGLLAFGDGDENPEPAKPKKPTAKELGQKKKKAREAAKREKRSQVLTRLDLDWTSDPGGNWTGFLPTGDGWSDPDDLGDQNDDSYNPRYRTVVYFGDEEGFVVVDTTPAQDPTQDPANYTVNGKRLSNQRVRHGDFVFADLISFKGGTDVCVDDSPCAQVMLSDGDGGGITILAQGESMYQSKTIVKKFAATVDRDY